MNTRRVVRHGREHAGFVASNDLWLDIKQGNRKNRKDCAAHGERPSQFCAYLGRAAHSIVVWFKVDPLTGGAGHRNSLVHFDGDTIGGKYLGYGMRNARLSSKRFMELCPR